MSLQTRKYILKIVNQDHGIYDKQLTNFILNYEKELLLTNDMDLLVHVDETEVVDELNCFIAELDFNLDYFFLLTKCIVKRFDLKKDKKSITKLSVDIRKKQTWESDNIIQFDKFTQKITYTDITVTFLPTILFNRELELYDLMLELQKNELEEIADETITESTKE